MGTCAKCGQANRPGAGFCSQCGAALPAACAACGAELEPDARFCDSCGTAVAGAPEAARKTITVVFGDLVGSTALQEVLDPESARALMARFYDAMRAAVARHGGEVHKFVGDAVVAIFGTPVVSEDDAVRAVRCAGDMVADLEALGADLERDWGVRLRMRTGVNTGELVVSGDELVGDTMNTTARFEQAAAPGEVLLGEATWRLVRHEVELEEIEPLTMKGKAEPVRAWRLVSSTPSAAEVPTESALVGREAELGRLRRALEGALEARECRLVTVIGWPGVGKTRLAEEFGRSVGDRAAVVVGHCEQTGEGITFLPVAEVLREVNGIGEADPPDEVRRKLGLLIPDDDPDRDRLVERVAGILGLAEPASPQETFWALRRGLEHLARIRPLVLVLDDVHWGEPMFLDLIEHLVEWVRDAPALIVALARPELREAREALTVPGVRADEVIDLEPLDSDQSEALLTGVLGRAELPESLRERIVSTAEGNPLFLGELLRMLVDEGALRREGDVWVPAGDEAEVEVPPTITALLAARIERLRADERAVVERAAVIGKQFYRGAVAELVTPPVRIGIDGHLEALRRKDMVEPDGTYWIDEPVYRFHHVLVRDAAYRSLLKEARAELHERFADWLEEKAGELVGEHEEVIAFHLEQAYDYRSQLGLLDERGRALGARAAARLGSAGRRALAREDLAAAANLLARALACEPDDEASLVWELAEAVLSAGDTAAAGPLVDRLRTDGADAARRARADVLAAQLANLTGAGDIAATAESAAAATEVLARLGDRAGEAKGHHVHAQTLVRLGRVGAVEAALDHALAAARAADDRRRITAVLAGAPRAALWGPSPVVRASGRCLDVVRILRMTPGNRHVEAVALRCQAVLEAMRGRADAAREILAAGRATLEELGLALELNETAAHAGIVELLAGDPAAAERQLRVARDGFIGLGVAAGAAQAAALLARALVDQGRDAEALEQTELAEAEGGEDLKTTITWCGVRAEAVAHGNDHDRALELARRAVALAEPTDALPDKADASMALARVLLAAGRADEAREAAAAALALYEDKGHAVGAERAAALTSAPRTRAPAPGIAEPEPAADEESPPRAGQRPPELWHEEFNRHWAALDLERMLECYAEDATLTDHRRLALWEPRHDREGYRKHFGSVVALNERMGFEIDELVACDDRVLAGRVTWSGTVDGADWEVEGGLVSLIEDGLCRSHDIYEPDDQGALLARYAELGGGQGPLGDRPPERLWADFARTFAATDLEGLRAFYTDDSTFSDHRLLPWEGVSQASGFIELIASSFAVVSARWLEVDEVLACDDRVIALRQTWHGLPADGGGWTEIPVGVVAVVENGRVVSYDQYEPEDRDAMLARYAELGGRRPVELGDTPPERFWAGYMATYAAQDASRLAPLFAEDFVLADHRPVGWATVRGREGGLEYATSAWTSAGVRLEIDEVLACDDRVIAMRMRIAGSGLKAGEFELPLAAVTVIEHGRWVSADVYDADDRRGMIARYAELGGGLSALGERPPEQWFAEFARRFARQEIEPLLELVSEDYVEIDHRQLGWEPTRGHEGYAALVVSGWEVALHIRVEVDEVLACDDRLIAVRLRFVGHAAEGGGAFTLEFGHVVEIEDGLLVTVDQYEPDDREAMLARFADLSAPTSVLGDRPSERMAAEEIRLYNEHDADGLAELYAEDYVVVDHRAAGWGTISGREALRENMAAAFSATSDGRMDVDEVLACDDRVLASRVAYRGHARDGGGEFELALGYVTVYEPGRVISTDVFESEDREAMLARWAELGGGQGPLGDRPPEQMWRTYIRRFAAREVDRAGELYAEDFVLVDHRALGWADSRGRDSAIELFRSAAEASPDLRVEIDEVLACDDRVIALRVRWCGRGVKAGYLSVPMGSVSVYENGLCVRHEVYEPDDREAMLARYAELTHRALPPERFFEEYRRIEASRDLERLLELYAPDFVMVDHRGLGYAETRGHDALRRAIKSIYETWPDVAAATDDVLACDECAIAMTWVIRGHATPDAGGGEIELRIGVVALIEDGRWVSADYYEPDDRGAMLARYAELAAGPAATLGDLPSERMWATYVRHFNAHEVEATLDLYAEHFLLVDHRVLGWEPRRGRADEERNLRAGFELAPAIRLEVEDVLARSERVIASRYTLRGSGTGLAGEAEIALGSVAAVNEQGLIVSIDWYDPADEAAIMAKFAELTDPRPYHRFDQLYNERRLEEMRPLYTDDYVMIDRRSMGWEEIRGGEALIETCRSFLELAPDLRSRCEPLVRDDGGDVVLVRNTFTGREGLGGGPVELVFDEVIVIRAGLVARTELFDPADEEVVRARYEELRGGPPLPPERFFAEYRRRNATHDVDYLLELFSPDYVMRDHRALGYDETRGHHEVRRATAAGFAAFPDLSTDVDEVLACDERVIAMRWTMRGHAAAEQGGGPMEMPWGAVMVVEHGLWLSADYYEPDDDAAILARYHELSAQTGPVGDSPIERLFAQVTRSFNEHDLEAHFALHADDFEIRDHRNIGWGITQGQASRDAMRSAITASDDVLFDLEEVLLCDGERVLAARGAWRSDGSRTAGAWEIPVAVVTVGEQGLLRSHDLFEAGDEPAVVARFLELTDQPPWHTFDQLYNARRLDLMALLYDDDFEIVDRRPLGQEPLRGSDALAALSTGLIELAPDQRARSETVADAGELALVRFTLAGREGRFGEAEIVTRMVFAMRGGRVARIEVYDGDDEAASRARFEELRGR